MSSEEEPSEHGEVSTLETIIDTVTESSLPAPIKKNVFKAMGQLCTATVDVPVAYLEGIVSERRAETKARISLIEKTSNEIAAQMEFSPEYARAAVKKFGQRVVKEQINLDNIASKAVVELGSEEIKDNDLGASEKSINDDWLNTFEKEASQRSTEEMQTMFAKILAGEIKSPESYSIKTLKLLGELDTPIANLFAKFCSCSMVLQAPIQGSSKKHIIDARVCSLTGNAGSNSLQEYGFSFGQLNLLQEYGLIISDYNSWMNYDLSIMTGKTILPFTLSERNWLLKPMKDFNSKAEFKVRGVQLSRAGKELYPIVETIINDQYINDLSEYFNNQKLEMTLISTEKQHNKSNHIDP